MTHKDNNELVDYTIYATLASGMGNLGVFLTAIFYIGFCLVLGFGALSMLLGAFGIL
jgi:hypothetical protein